jgi:hypothetical protein
MFWMMFHYCSFTYSWLIAHIFVELLDMQTHWTVYSPGITFFKRLAYCFGNKTRVFFCIILVYDYITNTVTTKSCHLPYIEWTIVQIYRSINQCRVSLVSPWRIIQSERSYSLINGFLQTVHTVAPALIVVWWWCSRRHDCYLIAVKSNHYLSLYTSLGTHQLVLVVK